MSLKEVWVSQCLGITTRCCGLFSTRQQQSIGIALAWTDEHQSKEGRARAFNEWLHHSGRTSCGWRQAKTRGWRGGGTGDQARTRRKCLGRGASRECEGAAMGPQATRLDVQGQHAENTVASKSSHANSASSRRRWRARKRSWLVTGVHQKDVEIPKYCQTPGCQGCLCIHHAESKRSTSQNSECKRRVESAMRDDAIGAERFEESKRRKGQVAPGPDVIMGQSSNSSGAAAGSGEVHASRGTRRTAEDARLPSLQDFAEIRPVQSAHGEMIRLGELSCETFEEADIFCAGRLAASCS